MLTDTAIRKAKPKDKPYKVSDSQGLYLLVNPRGSKLWRVKYRINGVERKLAIGSYPEITLAEARSARDAARRQLAHSIDPNFVKRQARIEAGIRASNSFSSVAQELIENAAAAAICRKFIQDGERAQAFQVYETAAWEDLVREGNQKMATGRLKAHD